MDPQVRLTNEQAPAGAAELAIMREVPYHEAVGALNCAVLATCPDVTFTPGADPPKRISRNAHIAMLSPWSIAYT
jgi:hypothetical protein